jgi:holo-[acyl-carrier protein] synthase
LIVGLGLDISEIDRIEAALTRHGTAILQRLYTTQEIAYCESHKNKFERYAGRFAAKEAGMKALASPAANQRCNSPGSPYKSPMAWA